MDDVTVDNLVQLPKNDINCWMLVGATIDDEAMHLNSENQCRQQTDNRWNEQRKKDQ